MISHCKFLARNVSWSILFGIKQFLTLDVLKTLSDATLVAQHIKYFFTILPSSGNLVSSLPHHLKGDLLMSETGTYK